MFGTPITIRAQVVGDTIQVSLTDERPGIPPDERERVFESFSQMDDSSRFHIGAEVGLAICKGLIEAHGGRIWVEDTESGATITFTLPVA